MSILEKLKFAIDDDDFDKFSSLLPQVKDLDDAYDLAVEASRIHAREHYLKAIIDAGHPVAYQEKEGSPPVIFTAIKCQNKPALVALLEANAKLEEPCRGYTPFTFAVFCRAYSCAKHLAGEGAKKSPPDLKSAMEILQAHCEAQLIAQTEVPVWMELCSDVEAAATRSAGGTGVQNALRESIMDGICTFSVTNENFVMHPEYFECKSCGVFICSTCKAKCHGGHNVVRYPESEMYCDCGANTYASLSKGTRLSTPKCRCLPKVASRADLEDYKEALREALLDHEITTEEDAYLAKLRKDRGIAQVQHEQILAEFNLTKEAFALMYTAPKPKTVASKVPSVSSGGGADYDASEDFGEDFDIEMKIEKKFALIIANSNYREAGASLKNPVNDARAIHKVLISIGFDVSLHLDVADKPAFERIVEDYMKKLKAYAGRTCVSLFFFAGHAIEILGTNYFLHCDYTNAQLAKEGYANVNATTADSSIMSSFYAAQTLTEKLSENCTTNIIILDACRNNPFKPPKVATALKNKGSKSSTSKSMEPSSGISAFYPKGQAMTVLAAAPGFTAADGSSENKDNGLFTQALLKFLPSKKLDLEEVLFHTKRRVYALSNGAQQPWIHSALLNRIYIAK